MNYDSDRRPPAEPLVSAGEAAEFLGVSRRFLLSLARRGIGGSHVLGAGKDRSTWVFRLSELGIAIDHRHPRPYSPPKHEPGYDADRRGAAARTKTIGR